MNEALDRITPHDVVVKSTIPGRMRLRMQRQLLETIRARQTGIIAEGIAKSIELNDITGSALIHYDEQACSDVELVERLLAQCGLSAAEITSVAARLRAGKAGRSIVLASTTAMNPLAAEGWWIKSETPGRIRLHHPFIEQYTAVVDSLDATLMGLGGVDNYAVNPITSTALVLYDEEFLPRAELFDAIRAAMRSALDHAGPEGLAVAPLVLDRTTLHLSLSTATVLLAVATAFAPIAGTTALVTIVLASGHIFLSAAHAIFVERKVKVDILDATVIGLALAYRRLFPAALMIWIVDISNVLLDASSRASRRRLAQIFGRQVRKTRVLRDQVEVEFLVSELQIGDIIVVRSGEQIPVDGVVAEGEATVDQSALTGEFAPAERSCGDRVFAMTVVLTGKIHISVVQTGEHTNAAKMVKLIEQSLEHKVYIQTLTERFADGMVIPTLGLGGVGFALAGPSAMMAVVNADFGTGIRIAGPLALLSSLSAAIKNGILVKKGGALELLGKVDAVVFDKTGTLTEEVPEVCRILPLIDSIREEELLASVAWAEQRFAHPVARAILHRAAELGLELPPMDQSDYHVGFGVQVKLSDGQLFRVGSIRYMQNEKIAVSDEALGLLEEIHADGGTAIFAATDHTLLGIIELQARPRAEAVQIIRALHAKPHIKEICLISGDQEAPTKALARRLGIDRYFAEVLPQDKAKYIEQLQKSGLKVAMVGDGINDTVGLSQADVSISLRGAADAATDIADVVFMDGNLKRFELLFDISENLTNNVRRSFMLVLVPNTFLISGALLGFFGLGTSLILNNVFNLVATVNGLRAQNRLREHADAGARS